MLPRRSKSVRRAVALATLALAAGCGAGAPSRDEPPTIPPQTVRALCTVVRVNADTGAPTALVHIDSVAGTGPAMPRPVLPGEVLHVASALPAGSLQAGQRSLFDILAMAIPGTDSIRFTLRAPRLAPREP